MLSNHFILCCPLLLFAINLSKHQGLSNELDLHISGQNIVASASVLVLQFRFDLPAVQGALKSLLQHHNSKALILRFSAFFRVLLSNLSMVHDYWKNHRFDYTDLSWQSDFSAFFLNWFILIGGQLLYNILVVFAIHWQNQPQVYMCSPSWTPLLPPSPSYPSGSSQCTSPEHPESCIEPGLVICFTYDNIHVSMLFSHIIPPLTSPTKSKRLFYTSVSLWLSCI